jgi:hypothetical protein
MADTEQQRRKTNTDKALELLQRKKRVTSVELMRVCGWRFAARIFELRKAGHKISGHNTKENIYIYEYNGHKDDQEQSYIDQIAKEEG